MGVVYVHLLLNSGWENLLMYVTLPNIKDIVDDSYCTLGEYALRWRLAPQLII